MYLTSLFWSLGVRPGSMPKLQLRRSRVDTARATKPASCLWWRQTGQKVFKTKRYTFIIGFNSRVPRPAIVIWQIGG